MAKYLNDELLHVVPLTAPVDTAATTIESDIVGLKEYHSVQFLIPFGVITGDVVVVTVEECDDTTPSNSTAIAFSYRLSSAVGTDSMGDRTAGASTGVSIAATDDGKMLIIDVEGSELSDGFPYVRVVANPGGSASVVLLGIVALMVPRYPQAAQISAVD